MATTIKLKNKYTLEFTRDSVRTAEKMGFDISKLSSKPVTLIPLLVYTAFLAHHSNIKRTLVDSIYDEIPNKSDFNELLVEMYNDAQMSVFGDKDTEDDGDDAKNSLWEVSR